MTITSLLETGGLLLLYPLMLILSPQKESTVAHDEIISFLPHSISYLNLIFILFVLVGVLYVLKNIILYFTYRNNINFAVYFYKNLICGLYRAYISKSLLDFKKESSGSLSNIICVQSEKLIQGILRPFMVMLTESFILLGVVFLVFFLVPPWMMIIIIAGCFFSSLLYYALAKKKAANWSRENLSAKQSFMEIVSSVSAGISEIKVFNKENFIGQRIYDAACAETNLFLHLEMYQQVPRYLMETVFVLAFLSCFGIALLLGSAPALLLAKFTVVAAASFRLLPSVNRLIGSYSTFSFNTAAALRLLEVISSLNLTSVHQGFRSESIDNRLSQINLITIEGVSFKYPTAHFASLNNVSFRIAKKQKIGLVGSSGSGKSTLIKILAGLYEPCAGQIKADGWSIATDLKCWQAGIGYVPQDSFIMPGTIRENIELGGEISSGSDEMIWSVLAQVGFEELVADLPRQLDTVIGEQGLAFSGGQKQLICLARALYRKPNLLLLDEPTASLDVANEQLVIKAIHLLSSNFDASIVMSSHRIENFYEFDSILEFSGGSLLQKEIQKTEIL